MPASRGSSIEKDAAAGIPNVLLIAEQVGIVFSEVSNHECIVSQVRPKQLENGNVLIVATIKYEQVDLLSELLKGLQRVADPKLDQVAKIDRGEVVPRHLCFARQDLCADDSPAARVT